MAITTEYREFGRFGYYERHAIEDGDTIYLNLDSPGSRGGVIDRRDILWNNLVAWNVRPESGATVTCQTAFRPVPDKDNDLHWRDHAAHGSFTSETGYTHDAPLGAIRFTASGAGAVVEFYTIADIEVN